MESMTDGVLRTKMVDVTVGVHDHVPFVSDADELYVFVRGVWWMAEWGEVPGDGDIDPAVDWAVKRVSNL